MSPTSPSTAKKDFFISYNKADRAWAEWIAWQLEEKGKYTVTIQAWDFGPACNFVLEMDRAIQECERVLAVLSPDYLTSLFTKPEWAAYFAQDPTSERRWIVTVRVRECELKGLLAPIVYTDLIGKEEEAAKRELLHGVKLGRRKPDEKPTFPGRPPRAVATQPRFPGALPDIWNVPHLRNPNFTEPGTRLTEIHDALRSGKPAALTQALAGLGGVGKTQLAVEYAYRHAGDYALVWWVRAEQPATLAADYATLALQLDLPEKDAAEQPAIVTAVRDALRRRQDWLLVFDNVEKPERLRGYLPDTGGHVLITSRHAAWSGVVQKIEVKKWPLAVAVEFLTKRTGLPDAAAAADLAREMDCLPLALEQAASYIESTGGALANYLALFRTHQGELLKRGAPGGEDGATVATTWELSFQNLEKESPASAALLNLCAFFSPDDIPRDVIAAGAEDLPESLRAAAGDPLAFNDAVAAIRRYSLIETGRNSTLSLHRLVQAVIRDRLDEAGRNQWATAAVEVVDAAFPLDGDDVRTWNRCAEVLPHATTTSDFAELLGVALESTAHLLSKVGRYALSRADYYGAKKNFERALRIGTMTLGEKHPFVFGLMSNVGTALRDLGDPQGAKKLFKKSLRLAEQELGSDHPDVAMCLHNLSNVLVDLNDKRGARAACERALKIDEKHLPRNHPTLAKRLNNLGHILNLLGERRAGKGALERALQIDEAHFGENHPEVAIDINNLGLVMEDLGDLAGATEAFRRALRIDESAYGAEHPVLAIRLNNLASVLLKLGDLPGAKGALRRALDILKKVFGEDHWKTKKVREVLEALPVGEFGAGIRTGTHSKGGGPGNPLSGRIL